MPQVSWDSSCQFFYWNSCEALYLSSQPLRNIQRKWALLICDIGHFSQQFSTPANSWLEEICLRDERMRRIPPYLLTNRNRPILFFWWHLQVFQASRKSPEKTGDLAMETCYQVTQTNSINEVRLKNHILHNFTACTLMFAQLLLTIQADSCHILNS